MKKSFILVVIAFAFISGCSKKTDTPHADAGKTAEAVTVNAENNAVPALVKEKKKVCGKNIVDESVKDWMCVGDRLLCLNKAGCDYKGQKAPMRTVLESSKLYCNNSQFPAKWDNMKCLDGSITHWFYDDVDDEDNLSGLICDANACVCGEKSIKRGEVCEGGSKLEVASSGCDYLSAGVICKDDKAFCGDELFPGKKLKDWRCAKNHWICVANACECGDQKTGKFGTCRDGKPFCGENEMAALDDKIRNGYVCQSGKWTCADPEGCKPCAQFQTLNAEGKCEGKVSGKSAAKFVECKDGNCKCGDGACPEGGHCVSMPKQPSVCACGEFYPVLSCYDREHHLFVSNRYGEFSCTEQHEPGSSGGGDYYADVECTNPKGCKIAGDSRVYMPDDEVFNVDPVDWSEEVLFGMNIENEKLYAAVEKAFVDREFDKCGRDTALSFKLGYMGEEQRDAHSPEPKKLEDSCRTRTKCDTMAIPRASRGDYLCDMGHEELGSETCYSDLDYPEVAMGLRCNAEKGCACNQETCAKGALCYRGVCTFDTVYAENTCRNVYRHLAEDENSLSIPDGGGEEGAWSLGTLHINSPSSEEFAQKGDLAFELDYYRYSYTPISKIFIWDEYDYDESHRYVTADGTCKCGYSEVTLKNLDDYKCVQSLGYVCVNKSGCGCGDATCKKGSLCLREGQCSDVVMERGAEPERISLDEKEEW